jgi:CelD/BcsL family acetyltransferase involved in cellulose biosynthesis
MEASKMFENKWSVRFLDAAEAVRTREVREAWEKLIADSVNPDALYQSPPWLENLALHDRSADHMVALVNGSDGEIAGVVALRMQDLPLNFEIGERSIFGTRIRVANILGSQPLLVADASAHARLYDAITREFRECRGLFFKTLPAESPTWRYLHEYGKRGWLCHAMNGLHSHHVIRLPETFEKYLESKNSRTRRNFKRRLKGFDPAVKPGSRLVRIERADQVALFLDTAAAISKKSWQYKNIGVRVITSAEEHVRQAHLAESGLLRAYLLYYGETPCAFLIGYQYGHVFNATEVGFDHELSEASPGTVLFLRVIQDIVSERPARWFNFGTGDAAYKALYSNEVYDDALMLVVRDTLTNRLIFTSHGLFVRGRTWLRSKLRRDPAAEE